MEPAVGQTGSDCESQRSMDDSERIEIPETPEEFAEQYSSEEGKRRQHGAGKVRDGE